MTLYESDSKELESFTFSSKIYISTSLSSANGLVYYLLISYKTFNLDLNMLFMSFLGVLKLFLLASLVTDCSISGFISWSSLY